MHRAMNLPFLCLSVPFSTPESIHFWLYSRREVIRQPFWNLMIHSQDLRNEQQTCSHFLSQELASVARFFNSYRILRMNERHATNRPPTHNLEKKLAETFNKPSKHPSNMTSTLTNLVYYFSRHDSSFFPQFSYRCRPRFLSFFNTTLWKLCTNSSLDNAYSDKKSMYSKRF